LGTTAIKAQEDYITSSTREKKFAVSRANFLLGTIFTLINYSTTNDWQRSESCLLTICDTTHAGRKDCKDL
jgi:hypothetical protein